MLPPLSLGYRLRKSAGDQSEEATTSFWGRRRGCIAGELPETVRREPWALGFWAGLIAVLVKPLGFSTAATLLNPKPSGPTRDSENFGTKLKIKNKKKFPNEFFLKFFYIFKNIFSTFSIFKNKIKFSKNYFLFHFIFKKTMIKQKNFKIIFYF